MTDRLYYSDCYLAAFRARVVAVEDEGRRVYLDRTAFYPTSGGQPFDLGTLGGARIAEIVDEEDRVAHVLESPLAGGNSDSREIDAQVDWTRRYDHMQQHTGQHLLSAVFEELYRMRTVSFHLGAETSAIDLATPALEASQAARVEERCAHVVAEARPVRIAFEDASEAEGLRKESQRSGTLRIVSIEGIDRSACGGTHVRSTAEIGPLFLRKLEKVRGNVRVEFVCGGRALTHARRDYRTLAEIGRTLSAPFERAPEMIAAQAERIKALEKTSQRLATELAVREGRELHAAASAGADGIRRTRQDGPIDEAMRVRAQAFANGGKAVFLAVCFDPPSVLLAASTDSGVNAGALVKAAVTASGGRGGGNAMLAQGSVPSREALDAVVRQMPQSISHGAQEFS
jgi:alanyl-tRNA synthetase